MIPTLTAKGMYWVQYIVDPNNPTNLFPGSLIWKFRGNPTGVPPVFPHYTHLAFIDPVGPTPATYVINVVDASGCANIPANPGVFNNAIPLRPE